MFTLPQNPRIRIAAAIGAAALLIGGISLLRNKAADAPAETPNPVPTVALVSVDDFVRDRNTIRAEGAVESLGQAELKSQVSAPIARIAVSVGDAVTAGQLLVAFSAPETAAQVAQAEAGLAGAEARLAELRGGARAEDLDLSRTGVAGARSSVAEARHGLVAALQDAYTKGDDAVRAKLDPFYVNPRTENPSLIFTPASPQVKADLESGRIRLEDELALWQASVDALLTDGTGDLAPAVVLARRNLEDLRGVFDSLALAINTLTPSVATPQATVDGWKTAVFATRSTINGTIAALNGAAEKFKGTESALAAAEGQLTVRLAGAAPDQIRAQEAVVAQARAGVQAAQAQASKTVIRAPFAGTVASLPVRVGELVSPGQTVASIVNTAGLQVKSFVSDADLPRIARDGEAVVLGTNAKGHVLRIAPSVDARTKKVQVDIAIADPATSGLVVGQNVTVEVAVAAASAVSASYVLPLESVKVTPTGTFVYTVAEERAAERAVEVGEVYGESVEIVKGLEAGVRIIRFPRGISAGDRVHVQ